jgi:hypothetical protein
MKRIFWALVNAIALSLFFGSCSSEDPKPAYNFVDQDLSGKIENEAWTFGDGYAAVTGAGADAKMHITLLKEVEGEGCDIIPTGDMVIFTLPFATGLETLLLDFNNLENSRTVTLFDEEQTLNSIATQGAVEITSISDTEVVGRIDAQADNGNYVNGNFAVSLCQ